MPYLLEDLVIDRVDLVDEGANSAAFITLYKRKERGDIMDVKEILEKMKPEDAAIVKQAIETLTGDVTKATATIATLTAERDTAATDLTKAKEDLKTANDDLATTKSELDSLKTTKAEFDEEETMKSLSEEARKFVTTLKAQKEAAEETVRTAKEAEECATATAKAAELKALPIEQTKLVGILKGASKELIDALTTISAAIDGTVLGEVGKGKPGEANASSEAAWAKIEAKAAEIATADGISKAKAITKAVNENPDLYKEYLKGGAN